MVGTANHHKGMGAGAGAGSEGGRRGRQPVKGSFWCGESLVTFAPPRSPLYLLGSSFCFGWLEKIRRGVAWDGR